ncbi:MAG: delta-60 repeat domain-containing protein, partial [Actinomycetota bacterium]
WRTALTGSGKIVLAGWSDDGVGGDGRSAAARLLPDGRLDRSFHGDGTWVKDLSPDNNDYVVGLDLTEDDEILLGVDLFSNGSYDPHVVQLTRSGGFDQRFGGGDGMSSNWADGYRLVDVAIRSDGQIAGTLDGTNIASFRLGPRGKPDVSYGTGGVVFTSTPLTAEAMYLDGQERPVITGSSGGDPEVIRLRS